MKTIYELQQIADRLRASTEVNSISPEDTFGLQADVLEYLADMEQNAEGLGIHQVYASYAAMLADASAPVGSNGKPLRFGQLVVIYDSSNTTQAESGNVYAWQKGYTGASAWKLMGNLGNVHALQSQIDSLLSSDESMKGKLTELDGKNDMTMLKLSPIKEKVMLADVNSIHEIPIMPVIGETYHLVCEAQKIDGGNTYKSLFATINGTEQNVFKYIYGKSEHDLTIAEGTTKLYFKNLESFGIYVDYGFSLKSNEKTITERLDENENEISALSSVYDELINLKMEVSGVDGTAVLGANEKAVLDIPYTEGVEYKIKANAKKYEASGNALISLFKVVNGSKTLVTPRTYNAIDITYVCEAGLESLYFINEEIAYQLDLSYSVGSAKDIKSEIKTLNDTTATNASNIADITEEIDNLPSIDINLSKSKVYTLSGMAKSVYYKADVIDCNKIGAVYTIGVSGIAAGQGVRICKEDANGTKSIIIALFDGRTYDLEITSDIKGIYFQHGENVVLNPLISIKVKTLISDVNAMRIVTPKTLYAVTGTELTLFNDMIVTDCNSKSIIRIEGETSMKIHDRYISYAPTDASANVNNSAIRVYTNIYGRDYLQKILNLRPIKSNAGAGKTLNVLAIGGSTTDQGYYLEILKEMFDADVMSINLLGTRQSLGGDGRAKVMEEGRSGWRARTFFCADGTADGKPNTANPFFDSSKIEFALDAFNFSKYMSDQGFSSCDAVLFAFGGNESAATETDKNYCKIYYDAIIASMKAYNPNIKVGIFLYQGGYQGYNGIGQKKQAQEIHKCMIEWYDGRENENIYLLPVGLNLDPIYDYDCIVTDVKCNNFNKATGETTEYVVGHEVFVNDPIHPPINTGCRKMAVVCYSWLKYIGSFVV